MQIFLAPRQLKNQNPCPPLAIEDSSDVSTQEPPKIETSLDVSTQQPPAVPSQAEYVITAEQTTGNVDIVWVVDESPSMNDDVQRVNNNLAAFEQQVNTFANIKNYLSNENQWDVRSTNGPECLLDALDLDANNFPFPSLSLCRSAQGKLKNYFRPDSKKIVIFVTDDDSRLSAKKVQDAFNNSAYSDTIFYAFASPGLTECPTQDKQGRVYQDLTAKTGGVLFNLCQEDWSTHYDKLTNSIRNLVISEIDTGLGNDIKIIEVTLNGQKLAENKYSYQNGKFTANSGVMSEGDQLTIKYVLSE